MAVRARAGGTRAVRSSSALGSSRARGRGEAPGRVPRGLTAMEACICVTCGVQQPPSDEPPGHCPICEDERQYVRQGGQAWTTLTELKENGHRVELRDLEPGLTGVGVEPAVGIGQRALLVQTLD